MNRLHRGFTLLQMIVVVAIIAIIVVLWEKLTYSSPEDHNTRARMSELVLQATSYRDSIQHKAVADGTLASAGKGLTVTTGGRVSGGAVTNAGVVTIAGSNASIGTALTVILTPSLGVGGRIAWQCSTGHSDQWRYVPEDCRH
jgi:prepilin-type N-terminal cleavage/methylation domain-containing protein